MSGRVLRYRQRHPDMGTIRLQMRELTLERRRFGYRRSGVRQASDGITMSCKMLFRVYSEEGLKVRQRNGRNRARALP
jgi:putative transposase